MADPAQFDHDRLGHLLSDRLLKVPRFQRRYSWTDQHITEFWEDIARARDGGAPYFMGTVVLAADTDDAERKLIIDGQQRITTTALLFVAIRDRLHELDQTKAAEGVQAKYLSDYVLSQEENVPKLVLSPDDQPTFAALLEGDSEPASGALLASYNQLKGLVDEIAPDQASYRELIQLAGYLDAEVQVLLAVASGLAEAYVIFETLNDRGADLTTADLLKNYLFSHAGNAGVAHAEAVWTRLNARFDKPDDFVKFLRFEYMSREGQVTNRGLYKALQSNIGGGSKQVRAYLDGLEKALKQYVALREPDDASWSSQAVEVKDSLLAFRRFGFEASMPLLLAAFSTWKHTDATRFVDTVASWSVRAWMAGNLGGGQAEKAFCAGAVAIAGKKAKKPDEVLAYVRDIVPDDTGFRQAFVAFGAITTTRAKYLLAQLERQTRVDLGESGEALPDWSSKTVSVEHIFAKSSTRDQFSSDEEYDQFSVIRDQLQNLTLLEKSLNGDLDDKAFSEKTATYKQSVFELTRQLGDEAEWDFDVSTRRSEQLSLLAVKAWPR